MCRVRNLSCTAGSAHGKERYINGQQEAPLTLCIWRHMNELHLHWISYFIQTHEDEETEYDVHLLKKMGDVICSIGLVLDDVGVVS